MVVKSLGNGDSGEMFVKEYKLSVRRWTGYADLNYSIWLYLRILYYILESC